MSDTATRIEQLTRELSDSATLYAAGELDDQRYAVVSSIMSVYEFLLSEGLDPRSLEPLVRPIDALNDQYRNRIDPMFAERRRSGKPAVSDDQLHRIGTLGALANAWLKLYSNGADTPMQLKAAARFFRGRWFGSITAAQLKRARTIVSQEAADHPAVVTSKAVEKFIGKAIESHGRAQAMKEVVRHLNAQLPSPALGNWQALKDVQ